MSVDPSRRPAVRASELPTRPIGRASTLAMDFRLQRADFGLAVKVEVPLEGVTAVFGASGSGKTTLLRAVAGFERPDRGRVVAGTDTWFDSATRTDVPPHRRAAGFMFQDTRLFTHLDVAGNLDFAARRAVAGGGFDRADVVTALDLEPLLHRRTGSLSGGERQRVALGRTLLTRPRILLLDEPLAALERERKADILPYLEGALARFGIPTLYVSHDIDEVARFADRMLLLSAGRVQAHGPTPQMLERLDLQPAMGRFEAGVLLAGRVLRRDPRLHLTWVDVGGDEIAVPEMTGAGGAEVRLRIRARDVALATCRPEGISIRNVLPGTLLELTPGDAPGFVEALVQLRAARIRSRLTLAAVEELGLAPGMSVFALVKTVSFGA